jgi:putative ABC transport system permease protein
VSAFLFDLRDALRGLRRDRLYSAIVVTTLALTIGAAAAVFSIVDGVILKPLQYRDPGRLVVLSRRSGARRPSSSRAIRLLSPR